MLRIEIDYPPESPTRSVSRLYFSFQKNVTKSIIYTECNADFVKYESTAREHR